MTIDGETILEFKILTSGERNGEPIYIRAGDIRRIAKITVQSDSTYILGSSKMVEGSVLFLQNMSGMIPGAPPTQTVQETNKEVITALGGAVKVHKTAKAV